MSRRHGRRSCCRGVAASPENMPSLLFVAEVREEVVEIVEEVQNAVVEVN